MLKIGLRTVKTALCAVLAMIIAQSLNLLYAPAAGIIAVLSVGNTKRSSWEIARNRVLSLVMATGISFVCFSLIGYNPVAFGVYLLFFIPLSAKFGLEDGIVVNSVLITHFMAEASFASSMLLNEFFLMVIGAGLALTANLYMPDLEQSLRQDQTVAETMFARLLLLLSESLNHPQKAAQLEQRCQNLLEFLREAQKKASRHRDNRWSSGDEYFEAYFSMRRSQLRLLNDMIGFTAQISVEAEMVADLKKLLEETSETFSEENDGREILAKIMIIYENYRLAPLPKDREEFESRALLFQFLQSFTSFIEIKAEFAEVNQKPAVI